MALSDAENADALFQTLSQQLQQIWNEVGVTQAEIHQTWSEIDQGCRDVYKRIVNQASKSVALHFKVWKEDATCRTLLQELKGIQLGEDKLLDEDCKKMSLQIEKECLGVFKKKVDEITAWKETLVRLLRGVELKIRDNTLGDENVDGVKSPETIRERLASATTQLCNIEDETGQIFVIEFDESQTSELQEKEQQAAFLSNMKDENMQEFADASTVYEDDLTVKMIDEFDPKLQVNTQDQDAPVSMEI